MFINLLAKLARGLNYRKGLRGQKHSTEAANVPKHFSFRMIEEVAVVSSGFKIWFKNCFGFFNHYEFGLKNRFGFLIIFLCFFFLI